MYFDLQYEIFVLPAKWVRAGADPLRGVPSPKVKIDCNGYGTQINFLFDAVLAEYAKPGSVGVFN
jgi:hypothetical protein